MSGRSAIVRAKKGQTRDSAYEGSEAGQSSTRFQFIKIVQQASPSEYESEYLDAASHHGSFTSDPLDLAQRKGPLSHHVYPTHPISRNRKPILIASAIEKSDLRSQIDSFADGVRGNIGKLVGLSKSRPKQNTPVLQRANSISTRSLQQRDRYTPPSTAAPSLVRSSTTAPTGSTAPTYQRTISESNRYSNHRNSIASPSILSRQLYDEASKREMKIFLGAGVQRDWRSLRNRETLCSDIDTIVEIQTPDGTFHDVSTFYISSEKLRHAGCTKLIQLLSKRCQSREDDFKAINLVKRDRVDTIDNDPHHSADSPYTSPISDYDVEALDRTLSESQQHVDPESSREIKYTLHLTCKPGPDDEDGNWSFLTMRNFFALLHDSNKLCGTSLFETLSRLAQKIFREDGYLDLIDDKRVYLLEFLKRHHYDDARNNYSHAISLLAFSELPEIHWDEGFVEGYTHSTGMWNAGFDLPNDWHFLHPSTQLSLQNASLAMGRKLNHAEVYFSSLDFSDMWSWSYVPPSRSCARASYDRFRQWMYTYLLDRDPELMDAKNSKGWLTYQRMQMFKDIFNSLFDYLVDREGIAQGGDGSGMPFIIMKVADPSFQADLGPEMPFTGLISSWDEANAFPRIPNPYPLLPRATLASRRPRILPMRPTAAEQEYIHEKAHSYVEASNLSCLSSDSRLDSVIADFNMFEQEDEIRTVNAREARLGRWLLIYGALQLLATIDSPPPALCYKDDVRYHITVPLRGVLPWARRGDPPLQPPRHEDSHPFTAPLSWPAPASRNASTDRANKDYFDTLIRVDSEIRIEREGPGPDALAQVNSLPNMRKGSVTAANSSGVDRSCALPRIGGRGGLVAHAFEGEDSAAKARREARAAKAARAAKIRKAPVIGTPTSSNWRSEPGW